MRLTRTKPTILTLAVLLTGLFIEDAASQPFASRHISYQRVMELEGLISSNFDMRMSGNGQRFVFTSLNKKVYAVNANGTGFVTLFDYGPGCPCTPPLLDINEDGSKIVFTDSSAPLYVDSGSGSAVPILTELPDSDIDSNDNPEALDIRTRPRLTADGSKVIFTQSSGSADRAGLWSIGSDGAGLQQIFSYEQMQIDLSLTSLNPNTAFSFDLDVSDDGNRGIFYTNVPTKIVVFESDQTTLIQDVSIPYENGLAISGDGGMIAGLDTNGETFAAPFGQPPAEILLGSPGFAGARVSLDGLGNYATRNGTCCSSVTFTMNRMPTDGSPRLDLFGNCPGNRFEQARHSEISDNARRFGFTAGSEIWILDLDVIPIPDNVPFIGPLAIDELFTTTDFSVTPDISVPSFSIPEPERVCFHGMRGGQEYQFRILSTPFPQAALLDDGAHNDGAEGDGIFGNFGVFKDLNGDVGLHTIRVYSFKTDAMAAVDFGPFWVLDQPPSQDPPEIMSLSPMTVLEGDILTIIGINFDAVAQNNFVLFGNKQALIIRNPQVARGMQSLEIRVPNLDGVDGSVVVGTGGLTSNPVTIPVDALFNSSFE